MGLTGCSGYVVPPKGAPSMADVYDAANTGQTTYFDGSPNEGDQSGSMESPSIPATSDVASPLGQRIVKTLNAQFPTLPNPESLMYIFGHYAGADQMPVPGHFVVFHLYNKTYNALPNEVNVPVSDGQFEGGQ